ncbi:endoplasmic reticulum protein SC65-like isoform X2 [Cyprinus carpio]|uniref:Endoplasmic reticulum protein SC65-like isoform X2 n=1 Tax=Cyprinus carpio TaxID=7962 RepID=A0A9Q9XYQ4_CYPCA|nr:endoplasmic reticulum protein SC65-like isoform X2 [Cyprinus carpio]
MCPPQRRIYLIPALLKLPQIISNPPINITDTVSSEEAASALSSPPDEEFEGIGDYEESFLAEWWQEPKTKGDTGEPAE